MTLRYLFVDMNSYFASVEQQDRPELRGRPVGVVPVMAETTCCIAASYEAKERGVKTGTGVREARRLCPGIELVEARPQRYVEVHHRIVEAVESCLHVEKVCSIDEMYGRLMGAERTRQRAVEIGGRVKESLRRAVGPWIRCSIGVGPNVWLAKVASDMEKPDGLTVIEAEELPGKLYGLKLTDLPGVGPRMSRRLRRHGVGRVAELCVLSEGELGKIWGSRLVGGIWWRQLRGQDVPERPTRRRSVGHSHVLAPEFRTPEGARAVLARMVHKAAARMRRMRYSAQMITVSVRFVEGGRWRRTGALGLCRDTLTMLEAVPRDFMRGPRRAGGRRPLKVSVVLGGLVADGSAERPLFGGQGRRDELAKVMDRLDWKYGHHTVYFGSMWRAAKSAPTRIAFTQIPGKEEF